MDVKKIKQLINDGESEEIEFKESFHSFQEISKLICSFSNTVGGIILLGVKDNGDIKGLPKDMDSLQKKIASANSNIHPSPMINVELKEIKNKRIVLIIVHKADSSVFHSFEGVIYVRIGSTTQKLEGNSIVQFLKDRQILLFEQQIEPSASEQDLDKNKIQSYLFKRNQKIELNEKNLENFLLNKKLASFQNGMKIKNIGLLFFAKNIQEFYPYAQIKLVRFDGNEAVDVISYEEAKGSLVEMIEQSINFVKRFISKEFKITGGKREEISFVPEEAIREAIINAVAHRDYFNKNEIQVSIFDDRIEFTNPGGLPEGMSEDLLGSLSVQRNPMIYQFLKDYGYMEGLGSGISRIKNSLSKFNLKPPKFKITRDFFRLIIYNQKIKNFIKGLNKRQNEILEILKRKENLKSKEYAEIFKISIPSAVKDLNELEKKGYIKKVGKFRGVYYILKKKGEKNE